MAYTPRISENHLSRLYKLKHSQKVKKPITVLVREAIEEYLNKIENLNNDEAKDEKIQ